MAVPRSFAQLRAEPAGRIRHLDCDNETLVTLRRIRAYSIIAAAVMWTVWGFDMSAPGPRDRVGKIKGTDFLELYVAGSFAREGRLQDFYDVRTQHARAQAIVPGEADTLYIPVHSPVIALALAPLASLSYVTAVAVWFVVIGALYAMACWMMWRDCSALHPYRTEVIAACAAFPGLYATVLHGQASPINLLAVSAALLAVRHDRRFTAGMAIGCLAFKPHWLAAAVAVFVASREWRVVLGAIASAAAQLTIAWAAAGTAALLGYARILASIQQIGDLLEPRPGDSLRSFFTVFVPFEPLAFALFLMASGVVAIAAARIWRSDAPFELRASAAVLAMILVSPHAFAYDLILLAPVILLMSNWIVRTRTVEEQAVPAGRFADWVLCALFSVPLLAAVPPPVRLQLSVGAMVTLLAVTHRASRSYTRAQESRQPAHAPQSPAGAAATPDGATTAPAPGRAYTGERQSDSPARLRPAIR
jgi:hypothetical protein